MRKISFALPAAAAITMFAAETVKHPLENDDVRVLDVVVQPHEKTSMHEHKVNRVMIYRNAGTQSFEYKDGKPSTLTFKENDVKWSPAGGMHVAEVTSASPVNIVEIELKKPAAGKKITSSLDPLKIDPKHYKLEFENDQVRVFRVHFGPHDSTPLHEHQLNRISTFLTGASIRSTASDGKVTIVNQKANDIGTGGALKHSEQNLTDKPIDIVVTELKY